MRWMKSMLCLIGLFTATTVLTASDDSLAIQLIKVNKVIQDSQFRDSTYSFVPRDFGDSEPEKNAYPDFNFPNELLFFMYILGFLAFLAIVYLVVQGVRIDRRNTKVTLQNIDDIEDITVVDFDAWYRQALQDNDYRLALRIKFLKGLQALANNNHIIWKKEKTNLVYAKEISNQNLKPKFSHLSQIFNKIWYGNIEVSASLFQAVLPEFEAFIHQINVEQGGR